MVLPNFVDELCLALMLGMWSVEAAADGIGSHVIKGQILGLTIFKGDIQDLAQEMVATGEEHFEPLHLKEHSHDNLEAQRSGAMLAHKL